MFLKILGAGRNRYCLSFESLPCSRAGAKGQLPIISSVSLSSRCSASPRRGACERCLDLGIDTEHVCTARQRRFQRMHLPVRPRAQRRENWRHVLGESHFLWQDLVADLKRDLKLDGDEWNCYSVKAGLVAAAAKEETQHRVPGASHRLVSGVIYSGREGCSSCSAKSKLPARILKMIDEAKRYPEGTAVRIAVRDAKDAERRENAGED